MPGYYSIIIQNNGIVVDIIMVSPLQRYAAELIGQGLGLRFVVKGGGETFL